MKASQEAIMARIRRLSTAHALGPIHRALLGHDGSMTKLLELILCTTVQLKTIRQSVVPCPYRPARALRIQTGEPANERDILIVDRCDGRPLLYARSYAPLSRLRPSFKDDLMRADIPIGRIVQKHRMETRREMLNVRYLGRNARLCSLLEHPGPYLSRAYNIISDEKPLITITEYFPTALFTENTSGSS